ncbi:Aldehyde dehydrogenase N-terminal [Penicillium sp. CMV-2018d]|nr:Aldehyde dehydrogenase N-terminal [Penicillium sp. CMV-2018d]
MAEQATYGLSVSIISSNHCHALKLSGSIKAGDIHVNSMTLHDEPTLPHGGYGESGWGRSGSQWGIKEFMQAKTVTLHPACGVFISVAGGSPSVPRYIDNSEGDPDYPGVCSNFPFFTFNRETKSMRRRKRNVFQL